MAIQCATVGGETLKSDANAKRGAGIRSGAFFPWEGPNLRMGRSAGEPPAPEIPDEIVEKTRARYLKALRRLAD